MHAVQSILTVTFPFFALPAMLFRFGAAMPLAQLPDLRLILLCSVCGVLLLALTLVTRRDQRIRL